MHSLKGTAWHSTQTEQGCPLALPQPQNLAPAMARNFHTKQRLLHSRRHPFINHTPLSGRQPVQTSVLLDSNLSTVPLSMQPAANNSSAKRRQHYSGGSRNNNTRQKVQHDSMIANHPRQLTAMLTSAGSHRLLLQLLTEHEDMQNAVHISAALVRAARLAERATSINNSKNEADAQQMLMSFCQGWLLSPIPLIPEQTQDADSDTSGFSNGSVHQPTGTVCRLQTCSMRELANISWALAKQGTGRDLAAHVCHAIVSAASSSPHASLAVNRHSNHSMQDDSQLEDGWGVTVSLPSITLHGTDQQQPLQLHALHQGNPYTENTNHPCDSGAGSENECQQGKQMVPAKPNMRKRRTGRSQLQTATPQAIVNLLWAFARWFPDTCQHQAHYAPEHKTMHMNGQKHAEYSDNTEDMVPIQDTTQQLTPVDSHIVKPMLSAQHQTLNTAVLCETMEVLSAALLQKIQAASPQDLALACWSLGTLQFRPQQCALLPAMVEAFTDSCEHQTCQGLSNFTHGLVHLLHPNERLPAAAHEAINKRVAQLADQLAALPQETAVLMRALAILGHSNTLVWRTVQAKVGETDLRLWSGHTLSMIITAYASANRPCTMLIKALHNALIGAQTAQWNSPINKQNRPNHGEQAAEDVQIESSSSVQRKHNLPTKRIESNRKTIDTRSFATQDLVMLMWGLASLYKSTIRANSSENSFSQPEQHEHAKQDNSRHRFEQHSSSDAEALAMTADDSIIDPLPTCNSTAIVPSNETGNMIRDIIQFLAPEMLARLQVEKLEPRLVAMTAWALHICEIDNQQLVTACAEHAVSNIKQYKGRELIAILQAGTSDKPVNTISAKADEFDIPTQGQAIVGNNSSQPAAMNESDVWRRLWSGILQAGPRILPRLRHTELSALLRYAVHAGTADRQLLTWVVQLVLGAVAQRARRLKQQQLAEAGAMLFSDIELQGPDRENQQDMHGKSRPQAVERAANSDRGHICLSHAASDARHMPNVRSLADITWAVSVSGFRSPQLFQLVNVMCGTTTGASLLSPDRAIKLMYACVHAGWYSKELFDALCGQICIHLDSLSNYQMVEVLGMLAASRHSDEWLVSELCSRLKHEAEPLSKPDQMVILMWVIARLNAGVMLQWHPPIRHLLRCVPSLSLPALILLLWSLAVQQHVLLTSGGRSLQHHDRKADDQKPGASLQVDSQPSVQAGSRSVTKHEVSEGFQLLKAVLQQINLLLAANNTHNMNSDNNASTTSSSSTSSNSHVTNSMMSFAEYGALLPQALSLLLHSKDFNVVYEVTDTIAAWPPDVAAKIHALRLDASAGMKVSQQALGNADRLQHSQCFNHDTCVDLTMTHMGSASKAVRFARVQLHRQLTQLGLSSVLTEKLQTAPGRSAPVYSPEVHEARSTCPTTIPGLVLLPTTSPRPIAIVVASSGSFARNRPAEPMGWLFMTMTMLSEAGWQPAVIDVRNWRDLRGDSHQRRFVAALLRKWGVTLPAVKPGL